MKLTKTTVKALTPPQEGTPDHRRGYSLTWDDELIGFGIVTTNRGVKSFIVRSRINGRERRHTLGRATVLSADRARDLAIEWLGKIAGGGDPVADKHRAIVDSVTLGDAFDHYAKGSRLTDRTKETIEGVRKNLADWLSLPLRKIDAGMVERRYTAMSENSPGSATVAFRYFRAAWNQERVQTKDATGECHLPPCPTYVLSDKKLWNKHTRRQRAIEPHQMPAWFKAVESLPELKSRVFFQACLYTGCRRNEMAELTWADTHLEGGYVVFRQTKAGKHHADPDHYLPLPDQLLTKLAELKNQAVGDYVFGDDLGRYRGRSAFKADIGHIQKQFGPFGPHDCRRTFISTAEALNIPSLTTKKLVNHSTEQDVTGGYYVATVDKLRGPIQRIADQIDTYRMTDNKVTPIRKQS